MIRYNLSEFEEIAEKIGISHGDCLFIHSSILSFGLPADVAVSQLPEKIFDVLQKKIGEKGTIVVPAFNFDFCNGAPYDRQNTPSKNMGVFSEYIRKLPETKRSSHAMQSIAAIGKLAEYFTENDTSSAFDPDGAFDRLININAKTLLIGADFSYNSAFHLAEQKAAVPYRYWKNFEGPYIDNTAETTRIYRMFVRDLNQDLQLDFSRIEEHLLKNNQLKKEQLGQGFIQLYRLKDFMKFVNAELKKDPYVFIKKD